MKKKVLYWLLARLKKLSLCSLLIIGATIFVVVYPNQSSEDYNIITQALLALFFLFFLVRSLWEDYRGQKNLS